MSSSIPILRYAFDSRKCLTFNVVVEVLRSRGAVRGVCEDCERLKMAGA
jgi:hypothetical protein